MDTTTTTPIIQLTRDEIAQRIEQEAQRRLHMTAQDLVRAYREGRLADPGAVSDLLILASLLRDDDPLFVPA